MYESINFQKWAYISSILLLSLVSSIVKFFGGKFAKTCIHYFLQRCAIDDDSSSFKLTDEPKPEQLKVPANTTQAEDTNTTDEDGITEETKTATKHQMFDMGKRLSCKWNTGTGPRIGCVRDYPAELQSRALEQVNLSPRLASIGNYGPIPSPRPSPKVRLSPRLAYMGLPSPRTTTVN